MTAQVLDLDAESIYAVFAQRVQVDVVYDERARKVVDGLAGLLRFRR